MHGRRNLQSTMLAFVDLKELVSKDHIRTEPTRPSRTRL